MSPIPDDSEDFADIEQRFVREVVGVADFEWVSFDEPSPRTPLTVPLSEATVTLVSTAGAHAVGTRPMGAGGDAALLATDADVQLSHVGYDTDRAMEDLDVVYPVRTLQRLVEEGFIGGIAPTVVSTMGFVPEGRRLFERAVPAAVERIHDEQAHLALLREVLDTATREHPAGSIVPLDHRWRDDMRTRQLRKAAH